MVYKYVRKCTRQSWKEDDMLYAVEAATSGAMGVVRAGKLFGGPKSRLHRRLKGKNKRVHGVCEGMGSLQTALPRNIELDLVNHIHLMESLLFGLGDPYTSHGVPVIWTW